MSHGAQGAGAGLRPPATLPTYYCIRQGRNSPHRPRSSSSHAAVALRYMAPLSGHYVPGPLSPLQGSCFAMRFAQRAEKRAVAAVNTPTTMGLAVSSKLLGLFLCAWIEHRAKPRVFTSLPCTREFQVWDLGTRVRALRGHNLSRTKGAYEPSPPVWSLHPVGSDPRGKYECTAVGSTSLEVWPGSIWSAPTLWPAEVLHGRTTEALQCFEVLMREASGTSMNRDQGRAGTATCAAARLRCILPLPFDTPFDGSAPPVASVALTARLGESSRRGAQQSLVNQRRHCRDLVPTEHEQGDRTLRDPQSKGARARSSAQNGP